jgi:hypothetical protein
VYYDDDIMMFGVEVFTVGTRHILMPYIRMLAMPAHLSLQGSRDSNNRQENDSSSIDSFFIPHHHLIQ